LDADAIGLRVNAFAQSEALEQYLGERTAAAFSENGLLRVQFHAGLVPVGGMPVAADAEITGGDTPYAAVSAIQHLRGSKARIDFHAQRLGLLPQPAAQVAQTDDVVAAVMHLRRRR